MIRHILTFSNLHRVLAAEQALREATGKNYRCRPTPTPPGLDQAICGMSIEILDPEQLGEIVEYLKGFSLPPAGVHRVNNASS